MKFLFRYFLVIIGIFALVSCTSKEAPGWSNGIPDVESLFIGGKAIDSRTGEPVEGVTVVLCAYEKNDIERFFKPFHRDSTYTKADGSYTFSYLKCMETRIYSIKASDKSALRKKHYQDNTLDIYLEQSSPCYNTTSKSYTITENDLYLSQ